MEQEIKQNQRMTLIDRAELNVDAVENVDAFTEEEAVLKTKLGMMRISGSGLKLGDLSAENGCVSMTGHIDKIEYSAVKEKHGFLKGLFK